MKGLVAVVVLTGCFPDPPEPVPPPPVPTPDQCPDGFAPFEGLPGCYRELASASWEGGEKACEAFMAHGREAHLVVIDRIDEHEYFSMLSLQGDLWTGKMQRDRDDEFRNINYVEWDAAYFGPGEPNDYGCSGSLFCDRHAGGGDERCIEYKGENGLWNDESCSRKDRVICEWDDVAPYDWRPHG